MAKQIKTKISELRAAHMGVKNKQGSKKRGRHDQKRKVIQNNQRSGRKNTSSSVRSGGREKQNIKRADLKSGQSTLPTWKSVLPAC